MNPYAIAEPAPATTKWCGMDSAITHIMEQLSGEGQTAIINLLELRGMLTGIADGIVIETLRVMGVTTGPEVFMANLCARDVVCSNITENTVWFRKGQAIMCDSQLGRLFTANNKMLTNYLVTGRLCVPPPEVVPRRILK